MRSLILILALSLTGGASAQLEPNGAPEELVTSLTERVSSFYTNFQEGQFRKAEDFVDEGSKELYYNVQKTRIMGHEIKSITWAEDFRSAQVMVTALSIVPMMGSTPVPVPVGGTWNLIDGEWYLHLTPPEQRRMTPFGPVNTNASASNGQTVSGLPSASVAAPPVAQLRQMISLEKARVKFLAEPSEPVTEVVGITSHAPEGLMLRMELTRKPSPGLTVTIEPEEIASGKGSSISIAYDPKVERISGTRRLNFVVEPTGQRLQLVLNFDPAPAAASPSTVVSP